MKNTSKKQTDSFRYSYSPFLSMFFKKTWVEALIMILIIASVFTAVASILYDSQVIEVVNWFFTIFFSIELILRYFTYGTEYSRKQDYFKDWWLDWLATIPWACILMVVFPGGNFAFARLLRLPRILRILRFKSASRSNLFKWLVYRFKRLLEGSIFRQLIILIIVSLCIIGIFDLFFNYLNVNLGDGSNLWFTVISLISPDGLYSVMEEPAFIKVTVLILSFIGIILFNGILIAIIVSRLIEQLEEIKKGYGEVREKDHIILLGWNEVVPHILNELEKYCIIERKRLIKVVIVRETINDKFDHLIKSSPHVEVILRTGGSYSSELLNRISIQQAYGIVIFGENNNINLSGRLIDSLIAKTLVSIENLMNSFSNVKMPLFIINYSNREKINFLTKHIIKNKKLKENLVFTDPLFFSAKLISAMCINPYSYEIYNELLTAEGNEIHTTYGINKHIGKGKKFGDLFPAFSEAIPLGFCNIKENGLKEFNLIPSDECEIPDNAEIVLLAGNSKEAMIYSNSSDIDTDRISNTFTLKADNSFHAKNLQLVVGVNSKLPYILEELQKSNFEITIVDNQSKTQFSKWCSEQLIDCSSITFKECYFRNIKEVEKITDFSKVSNIIILSDAHLVDNTITPEQIDADTFSKLLMFNHIISLPENKQLNINIIVEMLTTDSEAIVKNIKNCFHVVGPKFIGRLFTTFTLYPELEKVFRNIIQKGDEDIICISIHQLIQGNVNLEEIKFVDILLNRADNCIPLGWVNHNNGIKTNTEIVLNPPKNEIIPANAEIILIKKSEISSQASHRD